MAKVDILAVCFSYPGVSDNYVPWLSKQSLLDGDIILFRPKMDYTLDPWNGTYAGKPSLDERSSAANREALVHWRTQLKLAFEAGKTILVFLSAPEGVYARTGTNTISGTGRSQKVVNHVSEINSYEALPVKLESLRTAQGDKVKLTKDGALIANYWTEMGPLSRYEVLFDGAKNKPLLTAKTGTVAVASLVRGAAGSFVMLPDLDFDRGEDFTGQNSKKEWVWTKEGLSAGRKFVSAVIEIHKALRRGDRAAAPVWASETKYELPVEVAATARLEEIDSAVSKLGLERAEVEKSRERETLPKALLYETGKVLEAAVIDALRRLGFAADGYVDATSEFDIVFSSTDGRFLGECEGKEASAINIDKLQQLERNLQEDFAKPENSGYAKGVLFGNPHRLVDPGQRKDLFTAKVIEAAKRSGIALVYTPDLFEVVKYLAKSNDKVYAKSIRECLANSGGAVVSFPSPKNV